MKRKPFFYDAQIKRQLIQIMSAFAGYQVRTGNLRDGTEHMLDVPVIYGDYGRVAAYLMRDSSDNAMSYVPLMSILITGLKQDDVLRQQSQHVERFQYVERATDPEGNLLINQPGKRMTVERYQPVPYLMQFEVAFWTSNTDQRFQLTEQIGVVFNPSMEIQLSNSIADWTKISHITFDGVIDTSSRAQPDGLENNPLDITTMGFTTTIWIGPPVKVYETKHIYQVHVPILEKNQEDFDDMPELDKLVIKADDEDIIQFESFN